MTRIKIRLKTNANLLLAIQLLDPFGYGKFDESLQAYWIDKLTEALSKYGVIAVMTENHF